MLTLVENNRTATKTVEPVSGKNELTDNLSPEPSLFLFQPKLTIGSPNDPLEKEADAMADKVMRMPIPEPIKFSSAKNTVNRYCSQCEKDKDLHRKEGSNESPSFAPSIVHDVLNSGGRSLDVDTRSYMEPRFNYDFSNVKIHDNDLAAKSARSINALAYTSGNNVVFNSGQYNTNSDSGKRLLAHELTHVVQQEKDVLLRDTDVKTGEVNKKIIVKEILRPGEGTNGSITIVTSEGEKFVVTASYQGNPNPGTYHYENKTLDAEDRKRMGGVGIQIDGRGWITRYTLPKDTYVHASHYELIVIDTRLFSVNGFLKLNNSEMAELTQLTEGFSDYDFRVLTKYGGSKVAINFEEAKRAIENMRQDIAEHEQFQLEESYLESKLFGLEQVYQLYKAYKCKSHGSSGFFVAIDFCYFTEHALIATYDGDAGKMKADLEKQLIDHGFDATDPIKEFENSISTYNENFVKLSLGIALRALDNAQTTAEKELGRYSRSKDAAAIYDRLKQARDLNDQADSNNKQASLAKVVGGAGAGAVFETLAKGFDKQSEEEYDQVARDYPVLSVLDRSDVLDNSKSFFTSGDFLTSILTKIDSIKSARRELIKKPDYVYKLDKLRSLVFNQRGIGSGSILDLIVQDKIEAIKADESFIDNIILVLSIALIPFTMGESAIIAFTADAALATIGVYSAIDAIDKYAYEKLFYDAGLLSDKPSVFWVVVAVAGAGLDLGSAASAFSKVTSVARKYPNLANDLGKFTDEIEHAGLLGKSEELGSKLAATERRLKDSVIKQAKVQQELDIAFKEAQSKLSRKMNSNPILDPDNYIILGDLAYKAAKKGYYHFEEYLLTLRRNGLIKEIETLSVQEIAALKKAYQNAIGNVTQELKAENAIGREISPEIDEIDDIVEGIVPVENAGVGHRVNSGLPAVPASPGYTKARDSFNVVRDGYAEVLHVGPGGQVHHAIELKVIDRYPGAFTAEELNALENMRGITPELAGKRQLHNSYIRSEWDRHYIKLNEEIGARGLTVGTPEYNSFVRSFLIESRDEIDHLVGQFFSESRATMVE